MIVQVGLMNIEMGRFKAELVIIVKSRFDRLTVIYFHLDIFLCLVGKCTKMRALRYDVHLGLFL